MKLSILIAFLLLLAVTNGYPMNWEPRNTNSWFAGLKNVVAKFAQKLMYLKCSGVECPDREIQIKRKTDDYELRCYPDLTFVATYYVGKNRTHKVRFEMFMRLVHYFSGENVGKVRMDITVPVVTAVSKRDNIMAMLFFLPFEHQASLPKPTHPEVSVQKLSKSCFYAKSFHWSSAKRVEMKAKELESALEKDGITDFVDPDIIYTYAVYDSPWTIPFLHYNEVWLGKKD